MVVYLLYYTWAVFLPLIIPDNHLGPLETVTKYLVKNHKTYLNIRYLITCLTHVGETFYSIWLCKTKRHHGRHNSASVVCSNKSIWNSFTCLLVEQTTKLPMRDSPRSKSSNSALWFSFQSERRHTTLILGKRSLPVECLLEYLNYR